VTNRRIQAAVVAAAVLAGLLLGGTASATPGHSGPVVGNDISWPQCPKGMGIPGRRTEGKPMPPASSRFVVIGLTNGPAFYPNPCLESQVAFARTRHLYTAAYAMTTYPTKAQLDTYGRRGPYPGTDLLARLRNTGYAQARFNVTNLRAARLTTPIIWVDVEPYPARAWSKSTAGNRAVVQGALWGYRKSGYRVGVYSTRYLWKTVVGSVRYGLPEWRATGHSNRATALASCKAESFQGGRAVLGQWVYRERDWNVLCPGYDTARALRTYFHKY
jgi:hypothetical protein